MKTFAAALAALALLSTATARADVGFESVSRRAGAPGDRVELTIGCGFCFPHCVGEPGHRHAPGDLHGSCMLGYHDGPPASFPVWLTPLRHPLDRYTCDPGEACPRGARPPHLPSFAYLGRAVSPVDPARPGPQPRRYFPRYRLTFGVPDARPGLYKYVLFCDSCVDGPRGTLVESATTAAGRLRVLPAIAAASDGGGGQIPWIAIGGLAAALLLGVTLLLRRARATGTEAGPAA
jgi:hypothetical protein